MGTKQFDNYADLITFTRASGATYLDSDGVLKTASTNIPRIEYDADGNRLGLLVEEQRTNLFSYSEDFGNGWTLDDVTLTSNDTTAPDGTATADLITANSNNTGHFVVQVHSLSAASYYFSVYVKADTADKIALQVQQISPVSTKALVYFDLTDEAVESGFASTSLTGSTITAVGNGWYHCVMPAVVSSSGNHNIRVFVANDLGSGNIVDYAGGTEAVYLWGAQLEAGSFPTSYIPTSGSTATRAADVASIAGADFKKWFNPAEGTVIVEAQNYSGNTNDPKLFTVSDNTSDNRIKIDIDNGTSFRIAVVASGNSEVSQSTSFTGYASFYKAVMAYAVNDFKAYLDGGYELTDTSGVLPLVDRLFIGVSNNGTDGFLNGHIKLIKYYPRRLSDAQLQELTQ